MKKEIRNYLITLGVGLCIAFLAISLRGIFSEDDPKEVMKYLCDGFFISSICVGGLGLLVFCSNEGAFDMIVYGLKSFLGFFMSKREKKYDSFYDYRVEKAKNKIRMGFILYVGIFLLLIAVIFYLIYNNM